MKGYATLEELHKSTFFAQHKETIDSVLNGVWYKEFSNNTYQNTSFFRAAHWNIERGRHIEAIIELFSSDPILSGSDVISLNEVDLGMNRTANRNIAFELAEALRMNVIFVPEFIEFTKGIGKELSLVGENHESLHGNAILSRYPVVSFEVLRLPSCFNSFEFWEKRYGERVALIAEIDIGKRLVLVSTHLEVRKSPECRAKQFQFLLDYLDARKAGMPTLICGDLNTGTFKRGSHFYTAMGLARLLFSDPVQIDMRLRHPQRHEPLFDIAVERGFMFEDFNDDAATCRTELNSLDEAVYLPNFLQEWIYSRLARYQNRLDFRLDFFFGSSLEVVFEAVAPTTIKGLMVDGEEVSDHDPIVCDFRL
ncbi:MAG: endonuclease/exonuclease/phosphatase family protein [Blastocatellia bacterium]|nr:endonuclease/exonuclease/phosphatase family protein [Blastocatellia bacterium]